jgi:putative ABC transport system permease protein
VKRLRNALALIMATFRIAARRLLANRRLAAGLLVGFTVAVAAAASVPAFANGALQRMLQMDLSHVQDKRMPAAVNLSHFEDPKHATTAKQFRDADKIARESGPQLIGVPIGPFVRYGALELTRARPADRFRMNDDIDRWMSIAFLSDLESHIKLVDGRMPRPGKGGGGYEAIVEEDALDKQDITVGAELVVPVNRDETAPKVKVTVVGAFRRQDPNDKYWFIGSPFEQVLFVDESTFMEDVLAEPKMAAGQYTWYYGIENDAIKMTDVYRLLSDEYELEARVAQVMPNTEFFEGPFDLLQRYLIKAAQLQLLLLLLAVPALAVVAYFVMVTSGLMVDGQRQEISVLRSRGASIWQVLMVYLLEGVLLGALALAAGYPLGILLARAMGASSGFLQFVDRKQPELLLSANFWLYGLGAAALAVLAYVAPVLPAARQSIISYKQESARKLQRPIWAKWGLDLLLMGLAGYAYYTLNARHQAALELLSKAGSSSAARGDLTLMQPLDVLAPALFVAGLGLFCLRLVPLAAMLVAKLAERRAGAPLYLTLTQLSRAAGSYTPVVLLLTLTVGMGLYSAAAARTLERNTSDRVRYAGGADLVLEEAWEYIQDGPDGPITDVLVPPWNVHYNLPGVVHPARVRTQDVTPLVNNRAQNKARLMAVDPNDFGQVAWFRPDLLPYHINQYLNLLAQDEEAALVSPNFLARSKLKTGDRVTLVDPDNGQEVSLVIYGTVPYWPGLYADQSEFFVANLDYVEQNLGLHKYAVWFKLEPDAKVQPIIDALKHESVLTLRADDTRQKLINARRDAQLGGLLGGLTSGFLISAAITVLGFWLYAALSVRSRVLQFGVLRAMGLSVRQLLGAVAMEQILAVALGVAVGTGLGVAASRLFVPFLQQSTDVASRTPPFVIVNEPADRIRLYVVLLFMLVVGLAGLMAMIRRMRVHEAIKLGEDH